jgi:hypothetical protein
MSLQTFRVSNDTISAFEFEPAKRTRFTLDGELVDAELFPDDPNGEAIRSVAFSVFGADNVLSWTLALWVERFDDVGEGQGVFDVFGRDGAWLGSVPLPPGLAADRGRLFGPSLEIGPDYLLGVWTSPQGADQVRVYGLTKPVRAAGITN